MANQEGQAQVGLTEDREERNDIVGEGTVGGITESPIATDDPHPHPTPIPTPTMRHLMAGFEMRMGNKIMVISSSIEADTRALKV